MRWIGVLGLAIILGACGGASSEASPTPELTAPPTADATASSNIARSSQVRFVSDEGISVTIDIDDRSGQLVGAVKGEEGLINDPEVADVKFANPAGDATVLRVEWFAPAGCHEHYGLTIDPDARGITIHASYEVGGDSIGGNCGITLRFSDAVPASEVTGVLVNTPPPLAAVSLGKDELARVAATDGLRVRSAPGTGSDSQRLEPLLPEGVHLFVVEGPVEADGYGWYRVFPYGSQKTYPNGWVAIASRTGDQWVTPATDLDCPSSPMTSLALGSLDRYEALACFGGGEIVVTGLLECLLGDIDYVIGGPDWIDSTRYCELDPLALGEGEAGGPSVFGDAVFSLAAVDADGPANATYRITGHFDDPASSTCTGLKEAAVSDEEAVQWCRTSFVATDATKVE